MQELCDDLLNSAMGVDLGMVTGRAGRGKTRSAHRIFTQDRQTIYILYREGWTLNQLLREIAFHLSGMRPHYRQQCEDVIRTELDAERRMIMVDEADRAPIRVLNGLRNIHDECRIPILLIGEEDLPRKMAAERRLSSRVRAHVQYEPISQADVSVFYVQSLGAEINPEQARKLTRHSGGDFRSVLLDAQKADKLMKINSLKQITDAIVDQICRNGIRR
ncbi:ATP-binding protein [Desulfonema ishimotonii]|nr:ATP-binding protein [Desulfonema ishimotonii]